MGNPLRAAFSRVPFAESDCPVERGENFLSCAPRRVIPEAEVAGLAANYRADRAIGRLTYSEHGAIDRRYGAVVPRPRKATDP